MSKNIIYNTLMKKFVMPYHKIALSLCLCPCLSACVCHIVTASADSLTTSSDQEAEPEDPVKIRYVRTRSNSPLFPTIYQVSYVEANARHADMEKSSGTWEH